MGYSIELEKRKARWVNFYDRTQPPHHLFRIWYAPDQRVAPMPNPDLMAEREAWAWDKYERAMARLEWLDDDNCHFSTPVPAPRFSARRLAARSISPLTKCRSRCR